MTEGFISEIAPAYHALVRDALAGDDCREALERIGHRLLSARVPLTAVRRMHEYTSTLLAHSSATYDVADGLFEALLAIYDRAMVELRDELEAAQRSRSTADG